jgi:hypothetical protein
MLARLYEIQDLFEHNRLVMFFVLRTEQQDYSLLLFFQ